jgi:acylglycerol lipase
VFHGLNSYIDHGAHIAEALAGEGYITVGFDHRGFGRSQGARGKIDSLEQHLGDCRLFVGMMKNLYPNLPFFSTGLSMGGMATFYLTHENPNDFRGAIMFAPAIQNGSILLNDLIKSLLDHEGYVNSNPTVAEEMKNDNLVVHGITSVSTA